MPDTSRETAVQRRSDQAVELRVAARIENVAVVRTLVGAVAVFEDLDVDTVADLRLAVDEACTQLVRAARPDANLMVTIDPQADDLVVAVSAACQTSHVVSADSFSWHVLSALTDDVRIFGNGQQSGGDGVVGIALTTRRVGSDR